MPESVPMKIIFIVFFTCCTLLFALNQKAIAQYVSPSLKFANPVLVSGKGLVAGAIYKFPGITAGIDCYITLVKLNCGATLVRMETPNLGYPDAWQPIIGRPSTPAGRKSWIDWEISFKTTAGVPYVYPCLDISAIDVDGDNTRIGEFVESEGHVNITVPNPTLLTITNMGNGRAEALAPVTNRPGIDTSAMDVRIVFYTTMKMSST